MEYDYYKLIQNALQTTISKKRVKPMLKISNNYNDYMLKYLIKLRMSQKSVLEITKLSIFFEVHNG